jgi:DNA ligase-1
MRSFARLFTALDETTKTIEKVSALVRYFSAVRPAEAAWALFFLSGRRLPMPVPSPRLRMFALDYAKLPAWLFDECYDAVGDLAETIALLLPPADADSDRPLDEWVHGWLVPLRDLDEREQRERLIEAWRQMSGEQVFVWNKLLTGGFRVGVSQQLVSRAIAHVSGLSISIISHRLMGTWSPTPEFFAGLIDVAEATNDISKPYPFFLAHPLEDDPATLGDLAEWHAEWKWDGIRCQLLRRGGQTFLWSRGEDLLTDRFPEITRIGDRLPDGTVLDGEILSFKDDRPLSFLMLQRRITRKSLSKKLLADVPVVFMAYDLLEEAGVDARERPFRERRARLEALAARMAGERALRLSPHVAAGTWPALEALRQESRQRGVEGLMLKRLDSAYRVGRVRGDWWKWKISPYTLDAVLMYAQPGNGKRASLFTDYTFGLWNGDQLVPFAKAYSGLTDEEIAQVDSFIRRNTLEKFGPVRTVKPQLVFEIGFESIQASTRHRSGIGVRFPRMLRWRADKPAAEADTLDAARRLIPPDAARPLSAGKPPRRPIETPLFDNLPSDSSE